MPAVNWNLCWPRNSPAFFYVDCLGGLGNRLKSLVSGLRLAKKMPGRFLSLGWAMDGYHCHCPLSLLFDLPTPVLGPEFFSSTGYIEHRQPRTSGPNFIPVHSPVDVLWVAEENFFYAEGEAQVMWGQHGPEKMANRALRDELLAGFASLSLHPELLRRVEDYSRVHLRGRPALGVHIRRGDNLWANLYCPDELFTPAIAGVLDEYPPETVLFCSSDSEEALGMLRQAFGWRVLTYPSRPLERGCSAVAVQDALVEMYLLARTQRIVRTSSSTFSQCAAWLGQVPTVEVGPLEHDW